MLIASILFAASVDSVLANYEQHQAKHLVPMLSEMIQFQTHEHDREAHAAQKAWLLRVAADLNFVARDAGKVTEIELPAKNENAPVLGLVIHGDVVPAEPDAWSFGPFSGHVENGFVHGRGSADDKGPLIQALLAMKALADSGVARTHTIRLLVGSEEESGATEMAEYLATHKAPDYSLVLDSEFPVVVGEKAWDGLAVVSSLTSREEKIFDVASMNAGLSPSIVPDHAEVQLRWRGEGLNWTKIAEELAAIKMPEGTRLVTGPGKEGDLLRVVAYGKSTHAGVNLANGRNAIVALAKALEGRLPKGGADDLLAFARLAGHDLHGTALGITDNDPVWGRYAVNVGTVKPLATDPTKFVLYINFRRTPPRTAAQMKAHLAARVAEFNKKSGAALTIDEQLSYFADEPFGVDPNAKLVKRLMAAYERATGTKAKPAISGGGTYAKRIPNAIAFGMWFPGKPYPGHDVDEKVPIDDLQKGARVLIHALTDIATGEKVEAPFAP